MQKFQKFDAEGSPLRMEIFLIYFGLDLIACGQIPDLVLLVQIPQPLLRDSDFLLFCAEFPLDLPGSPKKT